MHEALRATLKQAAFCSSRTPGEAGNQLIWKDILRGPQHGFSEVMPAHCGKQEQTTTLSKEPMHRLAALLGIFSIALPAEAQDLCSDILSRGIFNTETVTKSAQSKEQFRKWLCTSEFKTLQEAEGGGIGLGLKIDNIDFSLNGDYDQAKLEAWKKNHCSDVEKSASKDSAYQTLKSTVEPVIIAAWDSCMRREPPQATGLICQLRGEDDQVRLEVRWTPVDNSAPNPTVTSLDIWGQSKCTNGIPTVGNKLAIGTTSITCTRTKTTSGNYDLFSLTINTASGHSCQKTLAGGFPADVTLGGNRIYSEDTVIRGKNILIKAGTALRVKHGKKLELRAERISVEGDGATIDGTGDTGAPGPKGRDAKRPFMDVKKIQEQYPAMKSLEMVSHIGPLIPICKLAMSEQDRLQKPDTYTDPKGWAMLHGAMGGKGGQGGRGATIVIAGQVTGTLSTIVSGGQGGPGGAPGLPGTFVHKDGVLECTASLPGLAGDKGLDGRVVWE